MPNLIFAILKQSPNISSRYLGRPVIALNRIDSYDGKNVTFHYHRHEDNAFVKKCIPALDFISFAHPPEGMTAKLVKNMSDSDLLDMHYFLTEDDDWDGEEPEEGFYIDFFQ